MNTKIIKYILLTVVLFMLIIVISFISIDKYKEKQDKTEKEHVIVDTYVVDKYYEEGYCSFYWCKNTNYVLVSEQILNDGTKIAWTHNVNQQTYNSYNIGDKLEVCEYHEKLKIDE